MGKHDVVTQGTLAPTAKVLAGWITGAGATAVLGLVAAVSDAVPAGTFWGALVTGLLSGAAAWIKKARRIEQGA